MPRVRITKQESEQEQRQVIRVSWWGLGLEEAASEDVVATKSAEDSVSIQRPRPRTSISEKRAGNSSSI